MSCLVSCVAPEHRKQLPQCIQTIINLLLRRKTAEAEPKRRLQLFLLSLIHIAARSPMVLFIFFGKPSTISVTSYSVTSSSILASVFRSLFSDVRRTISIPCAVIDVYKRQDTAAFSDSRVTEARKQGCGRGRLPVRSHNG